MKLPWRRRSRETDAVHDERTERNKARRVALERLPAVRLRRQGTLDAVESEDVLVSVGISPDGAALALWSRPAGRDALEAVTVSPGWARFPDATTAEPVSARITTHSPKPAKLVQVGDLRIAHPFIQPLPDDRVLLVGARCNWRPEGADQNAIVLDGEGRHVMAATLGDGIEHVQTTTSGDIWVGYFDEGVYGNYGWGTPGPQPVGSAGLVKWTTELEPAWRYPYDSQWGVIDDCYALNVDGSTAWACYYSDFPIVKVDNGEIRGWRNEVGGARALIVSGSSVGLFGGYGPERDRIVVGQLTGDVFEPTLTARLVLDDGSELPPARAMARGSNLHVFVGVDWYRIDLDDLDRSR